MDGSKEVSDTAKPEPLVDYIVHQYGLTRAQSREIIARVGADQMMIDAEAGRVKA